MSSSIPFSPYAISPTISSRQNSTEPPPTPYHLRFCLFKYLICKQSGNKCQKRKREWIWGMWGTRPLLVMISIIYTALKALYPPPTPHTHTYSTTIQSWVLICWSNRDYRCLKSLNRHAGRGSCTNTTTHLFSQRYKKYSFPCTVDF